MLAAALGAVSAWLVTWIPRLAVAGLTIVLGVSYLLALLVPMYAWPSWITRLSLFGAIGHPYLAVPPWGGPLFLVTQAVAGFVLAATTATRATM
ncbi:hypothetical protein ACFYUD_18070 [Nocardia tengchongensis]|uniref:hypothetical protein n=1 Tax=Nocardia tengchongensis TaxID=2055889 RepID=UPI00368E79CB